MAVKRAKAAGLLRADRQPSHHAILEFVLHGVRYAFPAVRGRQPSSTAAPKSSATLLPRRQTSVRQSPLDSANFWHAATQKTLLPPSFSRTPRARTVCRWCLIGSAASTPPAEEGRRPGLAREADDRSRSGAHPTPGAALQGLPRQRRLQEDAQRDRRQRHRPVANAHLRDAQQAAEHLQPPRARQRRLVDGPRQGRGLGQGFFGDFHGREIAAGVQAPEISDDWETERAYLNMEAR